MGNVTDTELLEELKADPPLLVEIENKILAKKLHRQILELANKAVKSGRVQIESVEDLVTLIEVDLMLIYSKV